MKNILFYILNLIAKSTLTIQLFIQFNIIFNIKLKKLKIDKKFNVNFKKKNHIV